MTFPILANFAATINELKRNPMRTVRAGAGETVLIIERNKSAFYVVPPALYAAMLEACGENQFQQAHTFLNRPNQNPNLGTAQEN